MSGIRAWVGVSSPLSQASRWSELSDLRELPLAGAYRIGLSPLKDERGFFARTVCEDTLLERGLVGRFKQSSVSFKPGTRTVRGMHYALAPYTPRLSSCAAPWERSTT